MSLVGQKTTTSAMDWEDFKSIISKLERDKDYTYCLLISIGVFTGLRISDILELRFNQFLEGDILILTEKKTKKVRKIKLNEDLIGIIQRVMKKMKVVDSSRYIFLNRYGSKPIDRSWVNVNLKKIFRKYGIHVEGNVSSHMFRKTLGNRVLKLNNYSDQSIILLMELFGHSSYAITKKYLGLREKEVLSVYDSLKL
ncbi:tyrosine-type recombinase/integrase [Runella salmonicolor]|uniref:Tyrosine-type recombinase/integrase n=1 Tax=Runella salmonicolor TaxID=2950278 RepID=A0ABT1FJI9_9BACT|nr:tyrosine-type recombinase/integrase [Runella salmonicolor]MCP1381911.1 tyrosine-type recombinase/integrase [Runella salmonicolor]